MQTDIRAELELYPWHNAAWSDEKLIAASPFRYDKSPSFYVYLRDTPTAPAGSWGDSGAYDAEFAKGSFAKLLAFLRNETEEETAEYLGLHAAPAVDPDDDSFHLPVPKLRQRYRKALSFPESLLDGLAASPSAYLTGRGVDAHTQALYGVRDGAGFVAMPWRLPSGRLANVKYRSTRGKTFWYAKGGVPIRELVYGADLLYRAKPALAVICEAEIDAMTVRSAGYAAVAVGGVAFGQAKLDVLVQAPVDEYCVLVDEDKAGAKLRGLLTAGLRGRKRVSVARLTGGVKDANEAGAEAVRQAVETRIVPSKGYVMREGWRR